MLSSVTRAVKTLQHLAEEQPVGVVALAEHLEINKSNASRLLKVLNEHGFVRQDPGTGKYFLGFAVVNLAQACLRSFEIRHALRPYLRELFEYSHETVTLVIEENGRAICIDKLESPHLLRTHVEIGQVIPMHAGSTSKALMAFFSEEARRAVLDKYGLVKYTPNTIVDLDAFLDSLKEIRERGYALSIEETSFGAAGAASVVLNHDGSPVAAIGVGGPVARISKKRLQELGEFVREVAYHASNELGKRVLRFD